MAGLGIGRLALATGMALMLAGCEDGTLPFGRSAAAAGAVSDAPAARASIAAASANRDVEAPEAFSMTGPGLWDGRPSLGGIWVAHASVKDPQRVVIRNPKNGKSVFGALFRRERLNPGPAIQISSDAADALGLLAGQPAELSIVAMKRAEVPAPAVAEGTVAAAPEAAPAPAAARPPARPAAATASAGGQAAIDPIAASAAAAIAKAEGGAASADPEAAAGTDPEAAAGTDPEAAAEAPALTWAEKRAQRRAERQAARAARAAERAAAMPVVTVTTTPLPGAPSATPLPEVSASSGAAAPLPATDLRRAYVQVGIFSTEANATRAADQLKVAGLTATLRNDRIQGKPYWRVIVGPAASVADRDALAARVKAIGYPDAYPVQD